MKLITFTVPCYNSAAYMSHCVETLLPAGEEAEIILVDDGSKDDTGRIADEFAEKYPDIVRVIHQENGGHGEGVNQGIRNARGVYFKVVDSDDWLDTDALARYSDIIDLSIGDTDFITDDAIIDTAFREAKAGYTHYGDPKGDPELIRSVCDAWQTDFKQPLSPDHVLVTASSSMGMALVMLSVLDPGDEVIVPVPSFVCYGPLTEMAGGVPVYVELKAEDQFRLTPEQLKAAITPKTKVLVLPFPSNPTGGIMSRPDLEAIAEVLRGTDIMVISDEIYAELTYGQRHVSMANLTDMYERTVVVNGFSKSHAMTGWRMGYVCAPQPVIAAMTKLHQFGIMSAPTTSQYAAIEAMRNGDKDIEHMREEYDSRRRYLVENLNRIGLTCFEPKGAFYVFPCIKSSGLTSEEFCERFLMEEKVAVIPGTAFGPGGEGFVRACYAASMKDIAEAVSRMDNFLQNLRRKQGEE